MDLEKSCLTFGFVPLTDCAPLVVAALNGIFESEGLDVQLSREPSWANIRDKVAAGVLDGGHMLAPMPIASTLGLGGFARPMVTALSLSLNGNGITVSSALYERLCEAEPQAMRERPLTARALRKLIDADRRAGRRQLTFATVFPFSTHHYELRYWLASAGIDPDREVRLVVIPPPQMVANLSVGLIDGYCVGEPWNSLAAHEGIGRMLISGGELWNNKPEKVLGVTREWAQRYPRTHRAAIRALIRAGRWLEDPANRDDAAAMLADPHFVGVAAAVIVESLPAVGGEAAPSNRSTFFANAATFPWRSHAVWFLSQMQRWGQLKRAIDEYAVAESVYCCDLYRLAAQETGVAFPAEDYKTEGGHEGSWTLPGAGAPIAMGPDRYHDGRLFDARRLPDYMASLGSCLDPAGQVPPAGAAHAQAVVKH